ncbi:hypothetical protein J4730_10385 [Klebsiella pneumoniae]|uniref:Uncharacterized protein n=1 Tax=Klebsiella pneumoniae TaxID=573 RepID=A0A939SUQ2_KLEPN|nr:hypothetical protein [Klebsiella pneumoniae]
MYAAESEVVYQFRYRGRVIQYLKMICSVAIRHCRAMAVTFHVKGWDVFTGEQVKETIRKMYLLLSVTVRKRTIAAFGGYEVWQLMALQQLFH